jgi:hypothetical protein
MNQIPIALDKIEGPGASMSFTSIPQFWTHLKIEACLQTGSGQNSDTLKVTFNGDTGNNYINNRWNGAAGTGNSQNAGQAYIDSGDVPGKTSGGFSTAIIRIANYALVQPHQIVADGYTCWDVASATAQKTWHNGGTYKPSVAAAITQITLTPGSGSFVAGSVAMLYGEGAF